MVPSTTTVPSSRYAVTVTGNSGPFSQAPGATSAMAVMSEVALAV